MLRSATWCWLTTLPAVVPPYPKREGLVALVAVLALLVVDPKILGLRMGGGIPTGISTRCGARGGGPALRRPASIARGGEELLHTLPAKQAHPHSCPTQAPTLQATLRAQRELNR